MTCENWKNSVIFDTKTEMIKVFDEINEFSKNWKNTKTKNIWNWWIEKRIIKKQKIEKRIIWEKTWLKIELKK